MREKAGVVLWVVSLALFVAYCFAPGGPLAIVSVSVMLVAGAALVPLRQWMRRLDPPHRGWSYWVLPDFRRGEFWPAGYWIALLVAWGGLALLLFARLLSTDDQQPFAFPAVVATFAGYGLYRNRTEGYRPPAERAEPTAG